VEDHIYARLNSREERIPSLKQLDRSNIVIHIDSFAKVAFPGLRVGWIVAPAAAMERLRVVKQTTDLHTDQLAQATLAEFLRRGLFSKHLA
jgi:2-aminoadipate transaminase